MLYLYYMSCVALSECVAASAYKNIKRRLHKTTATIRYNKTCKTKRLAPKYITINISHNSRQSIDTQKAATHYRINQEIKFLYLKKARLNEQLYKKHLECAATWPRIWTSIQQIIDSNLQGEMEQHYTSLNKKLDKLNNSYPQRTRQATRDTHRNSTHAPSTWPTSSSRKKNGSSWTKAYNTTCNKPVVETEQAIRLVETRSQEAYRIQAAKKLKQLQHSLNNDNTTHKRHIYLTKNIQHKIEVNNGMITQADKRRTLVVIYREDYHNNVHTFLTNNNFQTIPKNPTNIYHKQITQTIKQCNLVFHKEQYKYLTVRNPNPPTLKAQIKLHKDGNPIRPVINNIHAPSYKAAKNLTRSCNSA